MRFRSLLLCLLLVPFLGSCANLQYYTQAIGGQMEILQRARPIEAILEDPGTQPQLRDKLEKVRRVREFASRELGLPDNGSYRSYADLNRPNVVWNVFAANEFSTKPISWCFTIAGCVSYRGYFAKDAAERYADGLRAEGLDVYVAGIPAYSTLGWLNDPILNTFINFPETEVARLIFHELAHQVAYAGDDSTFNESFAVSVEEEGMRRWLARGATPEERKAYAVAQERRAAFLTLVVKYRNKLQDFYGETGDRASKRKGKERIIAEMRAEYAALKESWGGYAGYDRWFSQPLNNAQLASVAVYTQLLPAFRTLLAENMGDMPLFFKAVKEMARLDKSKRTPVLEALAGRAAIQARAELPLGQPRQVQ